VAPVLDVAGTGAAARGVPPVGRLYHFNDVPVAVSATEGASAQYSIGLVTEGLSGLAFIVTVIMLRGLSQPAALL
jgi:hypothetical protein